MIEPLRIRLTQTIQGNNSVPLLGPRVMPGQIMRITHLSIENDCGSTINTWFVIKDMVGEHGITTMQNLATGNSWGQMVELLILEGDQIGVHMQQNSTVGPVTFMAFGELLQAGPAV